LKGKSIIVLLFILQISEKAHSQGRQFELERVDQRSYFGDHFHDAAVSPDQRTIITCGPGVIKLWTLDGRLIRSSLARTGCETVSYSTSGQYFILQNREMSELWSIPSFSVIREFPGRALFAPFANRILVVSKQSGFSLQDFNGNLILEFARGEKFIFAEISKSGRYILSINAQNAASLWTIEGKKLREIPGEGAAILSVKMDPEEKEIILSRSNRSIQRYSLDGALLNSVFTDASIEDLEFSRDGSFILGTSTQYSETLHNACLILRRDGSLLRTRNLIGRYLPFHCHFSGENLLVVHEGNVFLESPKQEVIARYVHIFAP